MLIKTDDPILITAEEISQLLGISESSAYNAIKQLNEELKEKGYFTLKGRTNRRYFFSKIYGIEKDVTVQSKASDIQ